MAPATPFDIVRRTPKSNCGECGFPACLAFAAGVVTTGVDPDRCPYINTDGLDLGDAQSESMENVSRERDQILVEHLKSKIRDRDFSALAQNIGADFANHETLSFVYLGQEVQVDKNKLCINGQEPEDPRDQILLYNYMDFCKGIAFDEWIGMESMPNSISKVRTLATYCETVLARTLQNIAQGGLGKIYARLNASPGPDTSPDISVIVPVLPMLPIKILFWAEDVEDNFPAKVKVLFDTHALDVLDIESLIFAAERMAEHITEINEAIKIS